MKFVKQLMLGTLTVMASLFLIACGNQQDISGTWYQSENTDMAQMYLKVNDKQVSLDYAYVEIDSGFLNTTLEQKSGKMFKGEIVGNKIKISETYTPEEAYGDNPFSEGDTLTYSLSDDKKTLTLTIEGEDEELKFSTDNPTELASELSEEDYEEE